MVEETAKSSPAGVEQELKFHESARDLTVQQIRSYGEQLVRLAVSTAESRRHPLVQAKDVQYASLRLQTEFRNRKNVVFQFLGAGLLGVFLQGFVAEIISSDPSAWALAVYVVIGFAGVFGVFWSLIR